MAFWDDWDINLKFWEDWDINLKFWESIDLSSLGDGLNPNALAVALIIGGLFSWFYFADPMGTGMDTIPFMWRLAGIVIGTIGGYIAGVVSLNR